MSYSTQVLIALLSSAILSAACSPSNSTSDSQAVAERPQVPPLTLVQASRVPGGWSRYQVNNEGHLIDVYLVHDSRPKPLVFLIQGSGCAPIMTLDGDGALYDTTLFQGLVGPRAEALHFAIIEKRGVGLLRFPREMKQAENLAAFNRASNECSREFMLSSAKQLRVSDVVATIRAIRQQSWVQRVLVAGHSEGTAVSAGVIHEAKPDEIAAAGLFASAGPTHFFELYLEGAPSGDPERLRSFVETMKTLQSADDEFLYEGWPARRWKSYALDSTPLQDVAGSDVPLFVAQGAKDGSTLQSDLFVLEAIRQRPNRPLRYVVVAEGDHAFNTPSGPRLSDLFDDFVQWSLDARRPTGVAKLN